MSRLASRRGFTLIEVLIVIVVIAILAAIVVPRLLGAGRQARETSLRGHLHELRNSLGLFQAHLGCYPQNLEDLMASSPPAQGILEDGTTTVDIVQADWQGPYLTTPDGQLPVDPITGERDWVYDVTDPGLVHSAATGNGLDGTAYSTW
jgi:general secretion pathway protein G